VIPSFANPNITNGVPNICSINIASGRYEFHQILLTNVQKHLHTQPG
jgi:hypothetical protein